MKHLHKASGLEFECGELVDCPEGGPLGRRIRHTYDMTVITFWPKDTDEDFRAPILISYYFGEYDAEATDRYIDRWLQSTRDCQSIVEAYWLTNCDVLEYDEFAELRNRVKRTLADINYTMEVFNNEEHN